MKLNSNIFHPRQLVFIVLLFFQTGFMAAQKKKQITKNKIQSCTVTQISGKKKLFDSKNTYNQAGLLIEETNYNDSGVFISTKKYNYNKHGDLITEQKFNQQNQMLEIRTMKYNFQNQKVEEMLFNSKFRLIKKFLFSYDSKGLKLEKKTFDAQNHLLSTKKYTYTYY